MSETVVCVVDVPPPFNCELVHANEAGVAATKAWAKGSGVWS